MFTKNKVSFLNIMTSFQKSDFKFSVVERFLRYVIVDTQSDPASLTQPSTQKQKILAGYWLMSYWK